VAELLEVLAVDVLGGDEHGRDVSEAIARVTGLAVDAVADRGVDRRAGGDVPDGALLAADRQEAAAVLVEVGRPGLAVAGQDRPGRLAGAQVPQPGLAALAVRVLEERQERALVRGEDQLDAAVPGLGRR